MNTTTLERMLVRSLADNIDATTPGGVSRERILRRHRPLRTAVAWLPIIAAVVLSAFALITR